MLPPGPSTVWALKLHPRFIPLRRFPELRLRLGSPFPRLRLCGGLPVLLVAERGIPIRRASALSDAHPRCLAILSGIPSPSGPPASAAEQSLLPRLRPRALPSTRDGSTTCHLRRKPPPGAAVCSPRSQYRSPPVPIHLWHLCTCRRRDRERGRVGLMKRSAWKVRVLVSLRALVVMRSFISPMGIRPFRFPARTSIESHPGERYRASARPAPQPAPPSFHPARGIQGMCTSTVSPLFFFALLHAPSRALSPPSRALSPPLAHATHTRIRVGLDLGFLPYSSFAYLLLRTYAIMAYRSYPMDLCVHIQGRLPY